ncbi:MAG: DUF58 domain-containing protein [Betaproteobacteria bacterium]|nr:DUF58 domain-containing protein [Betaproteobacteria bacterium]
MNAQAAGAAAPRHGGIAGIAWLQRLRQRAFRFAPADRAPVVLRHSRIYILPTRRGYALIATLTVMLLTSLNYALSLGLAVTFLLSGLVAAALLHTFRNLAGIEIKPLAASDAFAGEPMNFALSLGAGGAARRSIGVAAGGAATLASIAAGTTRTVVLAVPSRERGRVALGRVTLSSTHPLGLWRGWAYVHFPLVGVAYPAPEAHAPPLPGAARDAEGRGTGRSDDADLAGLREYQRGDPLQRVAWKAVARGAGWFSKSFEGSGGSGPLLLSFSALPTRLSTEAKLSRLCAWVLAAERATRPFALSLPGTQMPPGRSEKHRREALTALALFPRDA